MAFFGEVMWKRILYRAISKPNEREKRRKKTFEIKVDLTVKEAIYTNVDLFINGKNVEMFRFFCNLLNL